MAPRHRLVAIHPVHGYAIQPQQDLKTIKRNARERNRVERVNQSYETLRQSIPTAAAHKKMSKVSIIQHALDYIQCLVQVVEEQTKTNGDQSQMITTSGCHADDGPPSVNGLTFNHHFSPLHSSTPSIAVTDENHEFNGQLTPVTPGFDHFNYLSSAGCQGTPLSFFNESQCHRSPGEHFNFTYPTVPERSISISNSNDFVISTPESRPELLSQEDGQAVTKRPVSFDPDLDLEDEDDVLDAIVQWQTM